MMTPNTVQQLLEVFRLFHNHFSGGVPPHRAYQDAVREVAKKYSVTYQTIGDGCRRRLKLDNIHELHVLLSSWTKGEPGPLTKQLKANSDPNTHFVIDELFQGTGESTVPVSDSNASPSVKDGFETYSFRLRERDALKLRALSGIERRSPSEIISDSVSVAVRERMRAFAQVLVANG